MMPVGLRLITATMAVGLATVAASAQSSLLVNAGFEAGSSFPDNWNAWGDGSFVWQSGDAHTGVRSMNLGGTHFALMYQRVAGVPAAQYTVTVWAKRYTASATGTLKLEFHDAWENKIEEHPVSFTAPGEWSEFSISAPAPAGTSLATATVVGEAGGMVLFDDVSLIEGQLAPGVISVDIANTGHVFEGFGAQIWGYGPNANYPDLLAIRQQTLADLNIKFVRIENYAESASWTDMQATRAVTDALGIKWIYMIWVAPSGFRDGAGRLLDDQIDDFAVWWAAHVNELYDHGVPVEYIELMNEPDSNGVWSTGVTAAQYNELVQQVRAALDSYDGTGGTNNLTGVGIVGPGVAAMDSSASYINALDANGANAIGAWSTHSWGVVDSCGADCIQYHWPNFGPPADAQNPSLPKFVSEYATHETTFIGVTYPHGDNYGSWNPDNVFPYYSVSNCMPFAVRVFENTLGLLNNGASAPFVWQLIDEPSEVNPFGYPGTKRKAWGLVDLWGNGKPVYDTLKTLYPRVPVGASGIELTAQDSIVYSGAFIKDNRLIVAMANGDEIDRELTIQVAGAEYVEIAEAPAVLWDHVGDPATGDPDTALTVQRSLTVNPDHSIDVTLPPVSTLTIVCDLSLVAGDLDLDGDVDLADLATMLASYGAAEGVSYRAGDLDADGDVDLADLAELLANYGHDGQ